MSNVFFHYADRKLNTSDKGKIKFFIETIFKKEKKSLKRLDYIFCSDEYLLKINQEHLQHDFYTDIITFDLSDSTEISGEIYISIDRVLDNANNLKEDFNKEILRVLFHGVLHLCGYKDKKEKEEKLMREMEEKYINMFYKV